MFRFQTMTPPGFVYRRRVPRMLEKIQPRGESFSVLDAGCGTGQHVSWFHCRQYVGFDIVNKGFEAGNSDRASFCIASIYALPFKDDSFDFIFCSLVLQHIEDVPKALSSLHSILKPGGTIFTSAASRWARSIGEMHRLFWKIDDPSIGQAFHYFDPRRYASLHRDAGFTEVREKRIDGPCIFFLDLIGTFFRFFAMKSKGGVYTHRRTSTDQPRDTTSETVTLRPPRRAMLKSLWRAFITPIMYSLKLLLVYVAHAVDTILPAGPSRAIAVIARKETTDESADL
jgi:SAM-dependent methyltransferase